MRLMDEALLECPFHGARQRTRHLRRQGDTAGRQRVARLLAKMGLAPIYQKPRTSEPHPDHPTCKCLLKDLVIDPPNQFWCSGITLIPMRRGFLCLVVIMDRASRKVLSWRLSNTLEVDFCLKAPEEALARFGRTEILNTDQGSPFTSPRFNGLFQLDQSLQ